MMIRNQIQVAKLKGYSNGYAEVSLYSSGDKGQTVEEVMPLRTNTNSQNLPDPGSDVLIAADNNGDLYLLGAIASENQPLPNPLFDDEIISDNGAIKVRQTPLGQIEIKNATQELIGLLIELITVISGATVTITPAQLGSPQPLSSAPALAALIPRMQTFKAI